MSNIALLGVIMSYLFSSVASDFELVIPKVNYSEKVILHSSLEKGIMIHENSYLPKSSLILMGHSGFGKKAVFNEILPLNVGDLILLNYPFTNKEYTITKKIMFTKGSALSLNQNSEYLYLITCDLHNLAYQWVFEAKLQKK